MITFFLSYGIYFTLQAFKSGVVSYLLCGCWKPKSGPSQEQWGLLTPEHCSHSQPMTLRATSMSRSRKRQPIAVALWGQLTWSRGTWFTSPLMTVLGAASPTSTSSTYSESASGCFLTVTIRPIRRSRRETSTGFESALGAADCSFFSFFSPKDWEYVSNRSKTNKQKTPGEPLVLVLMSSGEKKKDHSFLLQRILVIKSTQL